MYELEYLCTLLKAKKDDLNIIVDRYDALSDKCLTDDITDEEIEELVRLDEYCDVFDKAIDAINEILDRYF